MEISEVMAPVQGTEMPPIPAPQPKGWPTGVEPDDPPRAPRSRRQAPRRAAAHGSTASRAIRPGGLRSALMWPITSPVP